MRFDQPLIPATLRKRYKRFLADVELDTGEAITAHCANPGAMLGLNAPGSRVWLSKATNPKRKLPHSWEIVEVDLGAGPTLVGINTARPNGIVAEAIVDGKLGEVGPYSELRREVKYGRASRIDILLTQSGGRACYVEVKNVHLSRRPGLAEFPDSVTQRGTKHLGELTRMVEDGHRALMVFLIQRGDVETFAIAGDIDPNYAAAFEMALAGGVECLAYRCRVTTEAIEIDRAIPIQVV